MAQAATARALSNGYPVELELQYKLRSGVQGSGRTVSFSSSAIVLESVEALPIGARIELLIEWPVALNGTVGLRLWVSGTIVGDRGNNVAVEIGRYEFRTRSMARLP